MGPLAKTSDRETFVRRALSATQGEGQGSEEEEEDGGVDGTDDIPSDETNSAKKEMEDEKEEEVGGNDGNDGDDDGLIEKIGVLTSGFTGADMTLLVRR